MSPPDISVGGIASSFVLVDYRARADLEHVMMELTDSNSIDASILFILCLVNQMTLDTPKK